MATRAYTESSGTPGVTPSSWIFTNQLTPVSVPATLTQNTGAAMTSKAGNSVNASTRTVALGRSILGPLAAQTIAGTVKGQMRGTEQAPAVNGTLAMAIKIVTSAGADRGTLLAVAAADTMSTSVELAPGGTLTNRPFLTSAETASHTLTSQTATAGDYLVIEWGFRQQDQGSGGSPVTLSYGNNSATDLAEDTTTTAANNPWWEFSATITLSTGGGATTMPADEGSASQAGQSMAPVVLLAAGTGTYSLPGTATAFSSSLTAAAGSSTLSGTAATPRAVRRVIADPGTATLPGTASTPRLTLAAASSALTLTGTATP